MNENIERFIIDYHLNGANYHAPSSSFVTTFHMLSLIKSIFKNAREVEG